MGLKLTGLKHGTQAWTKTRTQTWDSDMGLKLNGTQAKWDSNIGLKHGLKHGTQTWTQTWDSS